MEGYFCRQIREEDDRCTSTKLDCFTPSKISAFSPKYSVFSKNIIFFWNRLIHTLQGAFYMFGTVNISEVWYSG